jgi:hypothetical protein
VWSWRRRRVAGELDDADADADEGDPHQGHRGDALVKHRVRHRGRQRHAHHQGEPDFMVAALIELVAATSATMAESSRSQRIDIPP